MAKILLVLLLFVRLLQPARGQAADTPEKYLARIRSVVASEPLGSSVVQRLDSLVAKHIPSRSYLNGQFNRDLDVGFKQRRLVISLNFYRFQVNLLCRNDTIFLSTIDSEEDKKCSDHRYNHLLVVAFLQKRNEFYQSAQTAEQLLLDIASPREFAFYCGDGSPLTADGAMINQLVAKRKAAPLLAMLASFNCETQAYGVAGLQQLQRRGYRLPAASQALLDYIKARNSELVTCSGCFAGLVRKIYDQP
ncbi:MAG: hypothetical protein ACRYF0_18260 [Janthinobacterium lividum]